MKNQLKYLGLFVKGIYRKRFLIGQMVRRDIKLNYLGSYLGLFWAFAQPLVMLAVIWFAFTYGLRIEHSSEGHPFALWLICGLIPWLFLQESIGGATHSMVAYDYLIKKTAFSVGIIPLIKIISSLLLHLVLLCLLMGWAWVAGYPPGWHWLQLPYYLLVSLIMLMGLGWLLSSLTVFVRDIRLATSLLLNLLFWVTPIFWTPDLLPAHLQPLIWANPFYFLVQGYRSVLLEGSWFWQMPAYQVYMGGISLFIFGLGAWVFQRLRPHFADVL